MALDKQYKQTTATHVDRYLEGPCCLEQGLLPLLRPTHKHDSRHRHAALACCTKACACQGLDGGVNVSIWQDDCVVLGTKVALRVLNVEKRERDK